MTTEIPVLIVGAGPTGLSLAIECCRYEIPFRLIEKLPEPSPHSKALAIWQSSQQIFAAQGCLPEFLKLSRPLVYLYFAYHGKAIAKMTLADGMNELQGGPLILEQSETERILTERLQALGGKIERGVELISIEDHKDPVACELKHTNGKIEKISCHFLAACDGARSLARKYLEEKKFLKFKGYTEVRSFLLGDFEFEGEYPVNCASISFSNSGAIAMFPVTDKILRLISFSEGEEVPTLELFQSKLALHGSPQLKIKNPIWLSPFRINERLATHFFHGRIVLLGDAAHIHSPAGGQGMNTGIQDAMNLGWKLAWALKTPEHSMRLLQTYQDERYPVLEKIVLGAAQKLHFGIAHGPIISTIKRILLPIIAHIPIIRRRFSKELSGLYHYYGQSALINDRFWKQKHLGVVAGLKMFDVPLIDIHGHSTTLFEHALTAGHVLIIFKCGKKTHLEKVKALLPYCKIIAINHDFIPEHTDPNIVELLDISGQAHQIYGANKPCWYLVRPDLYIARRGPYKKLRPIDDYFNWK